MNNEPFLLPSHRQMLEASGVSNEVIAQREYRSIQSKTELEKLNFAVGQRCVPGLLIPILGVDGQIVLHQFRPDVPRIVKDKPVKYETTRGAKMALDVPLGVQNGLQIPPAPCLSERGLRRSMPP